MAQIKKDNELVSLINEVEIPVFPDFDEELTSLDGLISDKGRDTPVEGVFQVVNGKRFFISYDVPGKGLADTLFSDEHIAVISAARMRHILRRQSDSFAPDAQFFQYAEEMCSMLETDYVEIEAGSKDSFPDKGRAVIDPERDTVFFSEEAGINMDTIWELARCIRLIWQRREGWGMRNEEDAIAFADIYVKTMFRAEIDHTDLGKEKCRKIETFRKCIEVDLKERNIIG